MKTKWVWKYGQVVLTAIAMSGLGVVSASASTFIVDNLNDSGSGSLREAILQANATSAKDQILFDVQGVIQLQSDLPAIVFPLDIGNSCPAPQVMIKNLSGGAGLNFLSGSGGSSVTGLAIGGFSVGVYASNVDGLGLFCNYIGSDLSGNTPVPNSIGVWLMDGAKNVDLGLNGQLKNVIAGNTQFDVQMNDVSDIRIRGNYIGIGLNGLGLGSFNSSGIYANGVTNVQIGESIGDLSGNVISNHSVGVMVENSQSVQVFGNLIGTNNDGSVPIPNDIGVWLLNGTKNVELGLNEQLKNVITGNTLFDIRMNDVSDIHVRSNYIGVGLNGLALGSFNSSGIYANGVTNVQIGESIGNLTGNVISNHSAGLMVEKSQNLQIFGNLIGTNNNGSVPIPNDIGVWLLNGTKNVELGLNEQLKNVIAGNNLNDVQMNDVSDVRVRSNYIGVGLNGLGFSALNNVGIYLNGASSVQIGESIGNLTGNVISNHAFGLMADNSQNLQIFGNLIGANHNGSVSVSNDVGVYLNSDTKNVDLGLNEQLKNVIAGNKYRDVHMESVSDVRVRSNYIGVGLNGLAFGQMNDAGIYANKATNVQIGESIGDLTGNVISNHVVGLMLEKSQGFQVFGNLIGTNNNGISPVPNNIGVLLRNHTSDVSVGLNEQLQNKIAFNLGTGVVVEKDCLNIAISKNSIFKNNQLGIDLNHDGVTLNDLGDGDSGGNQSLNFPEYAGLTLVNNNTALKMKIKVDVDAPAANVEFFANPMGSNSSGYGEGEIFIGEKVVQSSPNVQVITVPLAPGITPAMLKNISATSSVSGVGTSEFSKIGQVKAYIEQRDGLSKEPEFLKGAETIKWSPLN